MEVKDVLCTLECCDEFWAFRTAELFEIHLKQIMSSCKKRLVVYIQDLNINANMLFCNGHKLKQALLIVFYTN